MLRLLLYSHFFAPHIGGVERVVEDLASGLTEARDASAGTRFTVTVVTRTSAGPEADCDRPYRVLRCPTLVQLWRAVHEADVVHVAGTALAPMLLGMLARKPVVVEHHGFQTICPNGQFLYTVNGRLCPGHFMAGHRKECLRCCGSFGRAAAWRLWWLTHLRRFLCRFAAKHIMPTQWLDKQLALPRSVAVPHGIAASHQGASSNTPSAALFLFVGRLVASKGVHTLLEAAHLLRQQGRNFEVQIIGDGPERVRLETLAAQWDLAQVVQFRKGLSDTEVAESLGRSFALVAPSLAGEVFGMVLVEAMRQGVPVIASSLGSFSEVVQDGGLLFESGDAGDLGRQMLSLIDDPTQRDQLALKARQRAETLFSVSGMVEGHADVYEQLCPASA